MSNFGGIAIFDAIKTSKSWWNCTFDAVKTGNPVGIVLLTPSKRVIQSELYF
jgi:hypothetical protein